MKIVPVIMLVISVKTRRLKSKHEDIGPTCSISNHDAESSNTADMLYCAKVLLYNRQLNIMLLGSMKIILVKK